MCRFVEAVCIDQNIASNLEYHQDRIDRTFSHFFPGEKPFSIRGMVPAVPDTNKYKWRVFYDRNKVRTDFHPYTMRVLTHIQVEEIAFDYEYKFEDRTNIDAARGRFAEDCCLLFSKKGFLTDSFFSNIALLQDGVWYTPDKPLLCGTRRSFLLDRGRLVKKQIAVDSLYEYEKLSLINALIDLEMLVMDLDG
ncbi:MAG: aminotransferase class IV [Spirochaetales bacterium]|nr:aminotransferase class IV [Spirochaetales bacterium]